MKRVLVQVAVALLCGCGSNAVDGTSVVGAAGGTVALAGGASLKVPPGALPSDVTITIAQSLPQAQAPAGALSAVYKFGPEGTVFAKPVIVSIPVPAGTSAALFWTQPGSTTAYDALQAGIRNNLASALVSHFSAGFAGASCTPRLDCTPAACRTGAVACQTGTSLCTDTGAQPDGAACGTGKVCGTGACIAACMAGQSCSPSAPNVCATFATTCDSTLTVTTCTATPVTNGTACGTGRSCNGGTCVASRTVTGQYTVIYEDDAGTFHPAVPAPLPPDAIAAALAYDTAGNLQSFPGTLDATGHLTIPAVPLGHYFLSITLPSNAGSKGPTLTEYTASVLDLSTLTAIRPDATAQTSPTSMTLSLSNLDPFTPGGYFAGDYLEIDSPQSGWWTRPFQFGDSSVPRPATSATTYSGTFDANAGVNGNLKNLPDTSKGDVIYVSDGPHAALAPISPTSAPPAVSRIVDKYALIAATGATAGAPTSLTATNGQAFSLSVPLVSATKSSLLYTNVQFTQFAALATLVNPAATLGGFYDSLYAMPHSLTYPDVVSIRTAPQLLTFGRYLGGAPTPVDVSYGRLQYAHYPSAPYTFEGRQLNFAYELSLTAPGATSPGTWYANYLAFDEQSTVASANIQPVIGPAIRPYISDHTGSFVAQNAVGEQPIIRWEPPPRTGSLNGATSSRLQIQRLFACGGNTCFEPVLTATFYSPWGYFRVPAGILHTGQTYFAVITEVDGFPWDVIDNAQLRASGYPLHTMDAVTNPFMP